MKAGIILLDKPEKMTSAGAIAQVKRMLPEVKKIGHSGTLDPMATGLLVCFVNGATRLARFAEAGDKIYSGRITLGLTTDTDDIWGKVTQEYAGSFPSQSELESTCASFSGEISQTPPLVSAVKVEGERAYKLARSGAEFELTARQIYIKAFEIFEFDGKTFGFRLHCSKGTYVRSLARDIGEQLGCGGVLSELRREASLPFEVADAVKLEDLKSSDIRDWNELFPSASTIKLDNRQTDLLRNGNSSLMVELEQSANEQVMNSQPDSAVCYDQASGVALGLLTRDQHKWKIAVNLC